MCRADIGDQADIRPGDVGQVCDIPGLAGAEFEHREAVVRFQFEQAQRHAQLVVVIAPSSQHCPCGPQNAGHHFLDRGFAVTAGDADHHRVETLPQQRGKAAQREQHIAHDQLRYVEIEAAIDQQGHGAELNGRGRKVVAIDLAAGKRCKQGAKVDPAAVSDNRVDGDIALTAPGSPGPQPFR